MEFLEEHVCPPSLRTYRLILPWRMKNGLRSRRRYPSLLHSMSPLLDLSLAIIQT